MIKLYQLAGTLCAISIFSAASLFAADETPAPIEPPILPPQAPPAAPAAQSTPAAAPTNPAAPANPAVPATSQATPAATESTTLVSRNVNEFQGDDLGIVLRTLARQAKINLVVSPKVTGAVTMRLENVQPLQAIETICTSQNLFLDHDVKSDVYFVKTQEEKQKEPTESANYTFSYAVAKDVLSLVQSQLQSAVPAQIDSRTNTIFYREAKSNLDNIHMLLTTIDKPTQQVMIEARLVEVTANPKQSYGINWGGIVGNSTAPQTFKWAGSSIAQQETFVDSQGVPHTVNEPSQVTTSKGLLTGNDFLFGAGGSGQKLLGLLGGQFAILSAPQMSLTMRLLNEDSDAEFLANPRVVTANNQKATIKITRNQPVPELNFNEQTATAVFGGFKDKEFGNTLVVTPSINKDSFITLGVQPEISNKVGDATFTFAGATVASPIIDKRTLDSSVLIKSGDTLAIGGLLQDELTKGRTKVPLAGDIPILGYMFQERLNTRTKRNLLVFVTPTIIKQGYGTGLEDQVSGLHHSGEEYADPNGWRNNAKGAVRIFPTSQRQVAADYPKPGVPLAPDKVSYKVSVTDRDK